MINAVKGYRTASLALAAILLGAGLLVLAPAPPAEAAKDRACDTDEVPKGVEVAASNSKVWVAADGGTIQEFLGLATCTNASHTVGGDPHFIDVASATTKIDYTHHSSTDRKISYYDPSVPSNLNCQTTGASGPDDVDSYSSTSQYFTSYNNGKVIKSVKGTSSCTFTSYTVPGTGANPEGIDKSTDVSGFFVVDQFNKKLYKMTSGGSFTLCTTFTATPWFAGVSDANDLVWVTFSAEKKVRAVGTTSCLVAETSPAASNTPFDVAVESDAEPIVTFNDISAKIGHYSISSHTWNSYHDWSTNCSSCNGFGIDINANKYYAALQGSNSKLVMGTF